MTGEHVDTLNDLYMRRLYLVEEYVGLMTGVEGAMDKFRESFSKAKAVIGFSTTAALSVDNRESLPRVLVRRGADSEAAWSLDEASGDAKPPVFAPFGLLEPLSLKQSRKTIITSALPLLCDLATVYQKINALDQQIAKFCK